MKKLFYLLLLNILWIPSLVEAQAFAITRANVAAQNSQPCAKITSLSCLIDLLIGLLGSLIPLIFLLGLLYFLWNVAQFIKADPKTRESAKYGIIESLIGLFVMTAVYGLIRVIEQTFPLNNTTPIIPLL